MNTALLSGAILSAAAVGAAGLVLGVRQHRERCALATAQMHLRLLADQEERPQVAAMWQSLTGLSEDARARVLHCNRWMVFWRLQYRLRVVPGETMRQVARDFMAHPENALFWERVRPVRIRETQDLLDRRFLEIFDAAYGDRRRDPDDSLDLVGAGG